MTGTPDLRAVWDQANAVQRERWRDHVQDALPERLLEHLADGPVEELPD